MRVTANEYEDILPFRQQWPAPGLGGLRTLSAVFDRSGALVDLVANGRGSAERFDGPALLALVDDMEKFGYRELSRKSADEFRAETGRIAKRAKYRRKASLNPAAGILSLTAKDLRRMPTIHHGHFDNLKIDTGHIRVWLSRPEAHGRVLYERLLNGKWVNTTKRTLANLASRSHDL